MGAVYRHLGAPDGALVSGPKRGLDNAFVRINGADVMVVSTDPVSIIKEIGIRKSAWLSVHLIASDVSTSGVPPRFAAFSLNLPAELTNAQKAEYVSSLGDACKALHIAIVSGHTGTYPGAGFTVVGGGVMIALAEEGGYVDPTMARTGDSILMTKGAAIEATASLSNAFRSTTEDKVGKRIAARARALLDQCTVVKDAEVASSVGLGKEGVTSMHDATEGGVLGALDEMADATAKRFIVNPRLVHVSEEARAVCGAFGIDPLTSLSEGTLLLTCARARAEEVVSRMSSAGLSASVIGSVEKGSGLWLSEEGRSPRRFKPKGDGYWRAYDEASKNRS